jgi:hypothetical protein
VTVEGLSLLVGISLERQDVELELESEMELLAVAVEEVIEMDVATEDVEGLTEAGLVQQGFDLMSLRSLRRHRGN